MRGGEAFEEVLDQHIQRLEADRRVTFTTTAHGTATAYGFFFLSSSLLGFPAPQLRCSAERASCPVATQHYRSQAPRQPHIVVRARALSPHERHALQELIALGASLHEGFTLRELRSAFRALARRYHPDRHSNSGPDDKARLA